MPLDPWPTAPGLTGGGGGDGITQAQGDARYLRRSQNLNDLSDTVEAAGRMHGAGPLGALGPLRVVEGNPIPWSDIFTGDGTRMTVSIPDCVIDLNNGYANVVVWDVGQDAPVSGWWATSWNALSIPTVDGNAYRVIGVGAWD